MADEMADKPRLRHFNHKRNPCPWREIMKQRASMLFERGIGCALIAVLVLSTAVPSASADKMVWTDVDTDRIQRADLDGTDIEDLVTTGLLGPIGIELGLTPATVPAASRLGLLALVILLLGVLAVRAAQRARRRA